MQVKFEFENAHEQISFDDFHSDLVLFCSEILYPAMARVILWDENRLYNERVFVCLLHKWACHSRLIDDFIKDDVTEGPIFDGIHDEYDSLSFLIAEML